MTCGFEERVIKLSTDYGPTADDFIMIMFYESSINNSVVNTKDSSPSYASGVIQLVQEYVG